jgi:hypothetical protein
MSAAVPITVGNTKPGQSHNVILSVKLIVYYTRLVHNICYLKIAILHTWKCFVFPGVAATATFFEPQITLIVELFPTFGYPTNPTVIFPPENSGS